MMLQSAPPDNAVAYKLVVVGEGKPLSNESVRCVEIVVSFFVKGGVGKSALTIQVSQPILNSS